MGPHLAEVCNQDAPRAGCRSNRREYHCSTIPVLHPATERPAGYEPPPMICAAVNPPDTRLFFLLPELPGRRNRRRVLGSCALVMHCRQMFSAFCSPFAIRDSPPRVSEEKH